MRDIFVVAGNLREYNNLVNQAHEQWDYELKNRMVHYVSHPEILQSWRGCRVFLYGTYFKRPDFELIEQIIRDNGYRRLLIR